MDSTDFSSPFPTAFPAVKFQLLGGQAEYPVFPNAVFDQIEYGKDKVPVFTLENMYKCR